MSCASGSVPTEQNLLVEDLLHVHPLTAARRYRPSDRGELVEAVMRAAAAGRGVRPLGSNWSLSDTGVAPDVIDTGALSRHLSAPFPVPGQALPPERLRGGGDFLRRACADDARLRGRHFVHVEAGIKLRDLLADLAGCGLALPTMGDGAGQSLAGAISTGTHGGDLRVPPLVEWVRAVHLVSATGREIWITAGDSAFAAAPLVMQLPDWCPDARFIADDDTFAAVRLGAGRMGAVYAFVLEVVEQYTLVECNFEYRWPELGARLAASRLGADGVASGLFDAPLRDLDAGLFRSEVLRRTYYPAVGREAKFIYERGAERWPGVPAYFDAHPEVYARLLDELKLSGLAADLRGGPALPLHHLNIAISLADPQRCWVRRRWRRAQAVRAHEVGPAADDALIASVKANKTNPSGIVGALKDRLELDPLLDFLGWLTHDPRKQRLDWYLDHGIADIAAQHQAIGATSGETVFLVLRRIATDAVLEAGGDVARAVSEVIGGGFAKLARAGPASGGLHLNMLDAHDYGLDGAQCGNSGEFHFDAAGGGFLDFIGDAMRLARQPGHGPVFGYIGIRFTPAASALIAMQQFPLTASVEVATARSRVDDVHAGFWSALHDAARARRGIPHWGQEFRHTGAELEALYGTRLRRWRAALADLCHGAPAVFSTAFSRDKGLEPLGGGATDDDAIDLFLAALAAGDD
ncbi:D-arabinono-1,4-lactone oxidase [Duganella sp. CF517]|uniref:FAD-binding protein n=1 Tax=Duganella sp. CF517 TaxID=1881038 RepID=UPI0008B9A85E|nr:FAD-binding protein [Duganella sp. CF517]SEN50552.1 D-arabinono-1,4-lactone oxidase [Duganella sp. CF517]